ncbi:HAMP domain-containing histidine kinase [candidate division WOR-3 bacterium]|nr:HAMP domain-containing histidine kinase [candidate division WOR-3 bacterium]
MKSVHFKRCKPYDTSCHLKAIQSWHDEFESSIKSLISYLEVLNKRSKEARTECRKNYSKMIELAQAKTRFIHEVSHELKVPLAAVYNILNVILGGYLKGDAKKQIELLSRARLRLKETVSLLNDLLALSRLEEGTAKLEKETLNIKTILISVVKEMEKYAKKKKIQFSWQFASHLPFVFGNPELIRRVFENIIDNAVKYTNSGGTVSLKAFREDNFLYFWVKDTGIGIKEDEIPKLFDVFFRGNQARQRGKKEGMGLGLSLVKRIIDAHKGVVSVKSKFGQGTTVTVKFPEYKKGES